MNEQDIRKMPFLNLVEFLTYLAEQRNQQMLITLKIKEEKKDGNANCG